MPPVPLPIPAVAAAHHEAGESDAAHDNDFPADPPRLDPRRDLALVRSVIDAARPAIVADGGDIELVAIDADGVVRVRLSGSCTHCKLAGQTLGGLRRRVIAATGIPARVLPALTPAG